MHKSLFLNTISPQTLNTLNNINLSSLILDQSLVNKDLVEEIKQKLSNIEIYVSVSVFDSQKLQKYADALAIDSEGRDTSNGGVCPTHPGVRSEALDAIRALLNENIDGIWLDQLKYPTQWDVPEPNILDTCYCGRCLKLFEEYIGEPIEGVGGEGTELENTALYIDGSYYHEWLEFKASHIVGFAKNVKDLINTDNNPVKLGMQVLPWKDKDYGAGIQRVVAQDFSKLNAVIDVYSPMLFFNDIGKEVNWIGEMVEYFWQLGKPFLPFIKMSDYFEESLKNAIKTPSSGVCLLWPQEGLNANEISIFTGL